ncbi:MAG: dual specificity protein kinase kns1 [Cirrosporium novae-zelandiae]|nr:MAG: dual specificity protein kinase kns1 [Cirrosporium novae-zelandiae]
MTNSQSASVVSENRGRRRNPTDWAEFYKNGLPEEVIVIDDDTPPPSNGVQANYPPVSQPNGNATATAGQHATKKRKTAASAAYNSTYQPGYAYPNSSNSASYSVDRTASLQTTAPTSLGSYTSSGDSTAYVDNTAVGQKRKRVTRKTTRDEAKRRELEQANALNEYVPPPRPPIKAREVHVPKIPDVYHSKKDQHDDDDGHYIVQPDTDLTDRYAVSRLLGQGTFGKVVEAWDKRRKTKVAIKIIRSVQKYRDASRIELRVLSTLASNDKENRNKCIHLRDCFDFRDHICIVTDLLGQSVFDFLKSNAFVPFPSSHIQSFARQLLTSVAFLHDLNLIHTDLKPENILLVSNAYQTFTYHKVIPSSSTTTRRQADSRRVLLDPEIRLIDFGSATFNDEYHSSVVSTRHYRAPEIILQLGWSFPCDIWSIGCILVEFFTGDALFQTHDNLEHLAMMEAVVGSKIDTKLVRQVQQGARSSSGNQASKYFTRGPKLDYPNHETTKASKRYVKAMKRLHETIPATSGFNKQFLDLLRKIFVYDPKLRITAKDALKHPWFRESIIDDGTEAIRLRNEGELKRQQGVQGRGRLA